VKDREKSRRKAWSIITNLKAQLLDVLWEENQYGYNSEHFLIPWIQEEAEYAIKNAGLSKEDEEFFLMKVEHTIGEYFEE